MTKTPQPSDDRSLRIDKIASLPWETTSAKTNIFSDYWRTIVDIWNHKGLLWLLLDRETRAKYKGSVLGVFWSLARPLTQLLIYFIAIGQFLGAARSIPAFGVFVFVGLTAWYLFSETVSQSSHAILSNAGILKKVKVPAELFPLSAVGTAFFNFVIQLLILGIATLIVGQIPDWGSMWLLFPSITIIVLFSVGLALLLSAANVYVRDVQHFADVALAVLFWLSPIVYSYKFVGNVIPSGWLNDLYLSNPITLAVLGFQKALWHAGSSDPLNYPDHLVWRLGIAVIAGVIFLFISQLLFSRMSRNFAQEI